MMMMTTGIQANARQPARASAPADHGIVSTVVPWNPTQGADYHENSVLVQLRKAF